MGTDQCKSKKMRMKKILLLGLIIMPDFLFAQKDIIVSMDGSGDFKNIQEAINSLPDDAKQQRVISLKKGIYHEKVFIAKNHITIRGESRDNTIITISLAREEWRCTSPDDYGTATLNIKGSDIELDNLSVINSFGKDHPDGMTINCTADSGRPKTIKHDSHQMALRSFSTTRLKVRNCLFSAYGGDTVSPWNTEDGMFFFSNCIMEGGVDFYCPRGWAYAENCTFICHSKEAAIWHDGSKNKNSKTVLVNCLFRGDDGFKLGRYHRDAQFYLLNCTFSHAMADMDIYQREAVPPNQLQWGKRVYYFNCHREGGDYAWHKNNFPAGTDETDISSAWAFDDKWEPGNVQDNVVKNISSGDLLTDPVAENMLLYQRKNGGWPKHFQGERKVDYKRVLNEADKKELQAGYEVGIDATMDNDATSREIRYLLKAYKKTHNKAYLSAATIGIDYLLKAQYANGGWPQFYPDFSSYRSEITYNDNAMVNALNIMNDVVIKANDFDVIDPSYQSKCSSAVQKGIECILKTQLKQNGKLTAWCQQYDAKTLEPAMARKYELVSICGNESVGIVEFLMKIKNPSKEIIAAVTSAVAWFEKVKIVGYKFTDIPAPTEPSGRDRVFVKDSTGGVIWARFYDMDTNEPFFSGRDSKRKKTIAEVENERRIGYAWYGKWPEKLIAKEFPAWAAKWVK